MTRKLIIIGAEWCPSCKELYKKLSDKLGGDKVDFLDIDKYPHVERRYWLRGYPSVAYVDGDELRYLETSLDVEEILESYKFMDTFSLSPDILRCHMKASSKELSRETILRIISRVERDFDWIYGGLKSEFKRFPFDVADFLIRMYLESGVEGYFRMVHKTVDIVLQSIMFDYRRFWISRISYSMDWDEPDYIYLIEDQARFLKILSHIYLLTKNKIYLDLAKNMASSIVYNFFTGNEVKRAFTESDSYGPCPDHILFNVLAELYEASLVKEIADVVRPINGLLNKMLDYEPGNSSGYVFLGSYVAMIKAFLRFYEAFNWRRGLDKAISLLEGLDRFRGNGLYRDIIKPVWEPLDAWRCIPYRDNIELSQQLYRLGIHLDDNSYIDKSRQIIEKINPSEIKEVNDLARFGLVVADHIYGVDVAVVGGYQKIPSKLRRSIKPYTIVTYRDEDRRYIEYISKDFRFRM